MAFDANDLSPHEHYVVDRTRNGEIADFTPMIGADGAKPVVRAGFLRKLLLQLEADWPVRSPGVRLRSVRIEGALDLTDCSGVGGAGLPALELRACDFADTLLLRDARLTRLSLEESKLTKLDAHGLKIDGTLNLMRVGALQDHGECWIQAPGASVGGDLDLTHARLTAPEARDETAKQDDGPSALRLDDARISGAVRFNYCRAVGGVSLGSAQIGGDTTFAHAVLDGREGDALSMCAARIVGPLVLRDAKITGQIDLRGLETGGNLDCTHVEIHALTSRRNDARRDGAFAIHAPVLRVGGAALFQGANIKGEVFLADARIAGYLAFGGGRFMHGAGWAIRAPNARIGGNLTLKIDETGYAPHGQKTVIEGGAKFDRAQIDGAFAWLNLELRGPGPDTGHKGAVFSLADARIAGPLQARALVTQQDALIDLSGASCAALDDDLKTGWGVESATLDLDGFSYGRLQSSDRWRARVNWLKRGRRGRFSPQPYNALAQVFARAGQREAARRILLAQHDQRTLQASSGPLTWALSSLFGLVAGYGLAPIRAVRALALFFALGLAGVLAMNAQGALVNAQGQACNAAVEPALYAIDVALPVIDLGQAGACAPGRTARADLPAGLALGDGGWRVFEGAALWRWAQALYAVLGAILTALAVITFSGVMKPKEQ